MPRILFLIYCFKRPTNISAAEETFFFFFPGVHVDVEKMVRFNDFSAVSATIAEMTEIQG